jgi:hypothetical protein
MIYFPTSTTTLLLLEIFNRYPLIYGSCWSKRPMLNSMVHSYPDSTLLLLLGSYAAIEGGRIAEALADLTGHFRLSHIKTF